MSSRRIARSRSLFCFALAAFLAACDRPPQPQNSAAADRDSAQLRSLVDSLLPGLGRLASLPPRGPVSTARRDAAQVRDYIEARLAEEMPPTLLAQLQDVYALLGLVPDTLDLHRLLLELYTEQIVGYYDPHATTLYVVEGVAPESVLPVLAHELVHALQDQHVNLDSLIARERGNDRQTAAHAAIEGHATVVMFAFLAEREQGGAINPADLPNPALQLAQGLQAQHDQFPVFRSAPPIIREAMLFPYIGGADFVYRLWQAEPQQRPAPLGRWLPQSTEQVLHPEECFLRHRDHPTSLPPPAAPPGWRALGAPDQLGELETSIFLAHHLGEPARALARGWDGDRYQLLTDSRERRMLAWNSVWDDAAAADRFAAAIHRVAARLTDRHFRIQRSTTGGVPCVGVVIAYKQVRGFPTDTSAVPLVGCN